MKTINAHVKIREHESINDAIKRFNMQVQNSGVMNILKEREYYRKPSVKKRARILKNRKLRES